MFLSDGPQGLRNPKVKRNGSQIASALAHPYQSPNAPPRNNEEARPDPGGGARRLASPIKPPVDLCESSRHQSQSMTPVKFQTAPVASSSNDYSLLDFVRRRQPRIGIRRVVSITGTSRQIASGPRPAPQASRTSARSQPTASPGSSKPPKLPNVRTNAKLVGQKDTQVGEKTRNADIKSGQQSTQSGKGNRPPLQRRQPKHSEARPPTREHPILMKVPSPIVIPDGPKEWFEAEIRTLQRSKVRTDLNERHPEYWEEIAKCVNTTALGRNKSKRILKTADECLQKYLEIQHQSETDASQEVAIKGVGGSRGGRVARGKARTVQQRLKGNTKMWELDKLMNERAFVVDTSSVGLNIINSKPKPDTSEGVNLPSQLRKANDPTVGPPPPFAAQLDWANGTPKSKGSQNEKNSSVNTPMRVPFASTPLGEKALMMTKRSSVDWDMLGELDSEVLGNNENAPVPTPHTQLSQSARTSICELYADLQGPKDLDTIRGLQRMKKLLKKMPGRAATRGNSVSVDPWAFKVKSTVKNPEKYLKNQAKRREIRDLITEFEACLNHLRDDPGHNEEMRQDALCIAEDLLGRCEAEGLIDLSGEWDELTASNSIDRYKIHIDRVLANLQPDRLS